MRKYKVVKVIELLESYYYSPFQFDKNAINIVRGSCGHTIKNNRFKKNHYSIGDSIRCYECGLAIVLAEKKRIANEVRQALDEFDAWQNEEEAKHNDKQKSQ